VCVCVCESD